MTLLYPHEFHHHMIFPWLAEVLSQLLSLWRDEGPGEGRGLDVCWELAPGVRSLKNFGEFRRISQSFWMIFEDVWVTLDSFRWLFDAFDVFWFVFWGCLVTSFFFSPRPLMDPWISPLFGVGGVNNIWRLIVCVHQVNALCCLCYNISLTPVRWLALCCNVLSTL